MTTQMTDETKTWLEMVTPTREMKAEIICHCHTCGKGLTCADVDAIPPEMFHEDYTYCAGCCADEEEQACDTCQRVPSQHRAYHTEDGFFCKACLEAQDEDSEDEDSEDETCTICGKVIGVWCSCIADSDEDEEDFQKRIREETDYECPRCDGDHRPGECLWDALGDAELRELMAERDRLLAKVAAMKQ